MNRQTLGFGFFGALLLALMWWQFRRLRDDIGGLANSLIEVSGHDQSAATGI